MFNLWTIFKKHKYVCTICENTLLCDSCEERHYHPSLIYKTPFISSLKDTYNFIDKTYPFNSNIFSIKSLNNLSISLMGDKNICLRKYKGILIPIKINNDSNSIIDSSNFIIIVKGNKLINITYNSSDHFKIAPNSFYILKLKCMTPNTLCKENINIQLFSNKILLKQNNNLKFNINIEINEDNDEENLNSKLCFNEMVILYNKEHKNILISLLENELKGYNSDDIIDLVLEYNWDKKKILKYISSLQNND